HRPSPAGTRSPHSGEGSRGVGALQARQLDVSLPTETPTVMVEPLKKPTPALVVTETSHSGSDTVLLNHKRPPFDNIQVRRAINQALDRRAYVKGLRYGGAMASSAMPPRPLGLWGLNAQEVAPLPGFRHPARDRADPRRLLAQ